jgi:hypothetical protein
MRRSPTAALSERGYIDRAPQRSRIALPAIWSSGEKMNSRIRRLPVLISTVAAMPGVSGTGRPSMPIVAASGSSVTGKTRFWVRWAPANAELFAARAHRR